MDLNQQIEIPLSKTKIFFLFWGALAFVICGIFFILEPETWLSHKYQNIGLIRGVGIAAVSFFGLCLIYISKKLFNTAPGLIIDQYGIIDNSNATSVGLIEWKDISGIQVINISGTKILMLLTPVPQKYIDRAKSRIAKSAMKLNHKMYGSPIHIISNSLKIKFNDLEAIVAEELEKRS